MSDSPLNERPPPALVSRIRETRRLLKERVTAAKASLVSVQWDQKQLERKIIEAVDNVLFEENELRSFNERHPEVPDV